MTALPLASNLNGGAITEATFQTAIGDLRDTVGQMIGSQPEEALTIVSNSCVPTRSVVTLDFAASTVNLNTIVPGTISTWDGHIILVRIVNGAHAVVLKHLATGTGQLSLITGTDYALDNVNKFIMLQYRHASTTWYEIFRPGLIQMPQMTKSATFSIFAPDRATMFLCAGTYTINFDDAAKLGSDWVVYVKNEGTGYLTLDPFSTQLIDGSGTVIVNPGETFAVISTGSALKIAFRTGLSFSAGFRFHQLNGSNSMVEVAQINPIIPTNTAGAESGGLEVKTKTAGGALTKIVEFLDSFYAWGVAPIVAKWADDTATGGPFMDAYRDSTTPAANDAIGGWRAWARNASNIFKNMAGLHAIMIATTNGAERGQAEIWTMNAGTYAPRMKAQGGVWIGNPTNTDKGAGSLNVETLWVQGVQVVASNVATKTDMEIATDLVKTVTAGRVNDHPGVLKAAVTLNGTTGAIVASYNTTSVSRTAGGHYTWTINVDFSSANIHVVGTGELTGGGCLIAGITGRAGGVILAETRGGGGSANDVDLLTLLAYGDQ
jgi:hypothetical protein